MKARENEEKSKKCKRQKTGDQMVDVSTNVTMLLLNINTFNSPVNSPVKIQNPTRDF